MSGVFLIVLLAAAAAVQTVTAGGTLVCFAVSTSEVCTCPSQCQCLPGTDDGDCSKNSCDCNGDPTTMTLEKGSIKTWPAGGWGGADWGSHPTKDWWYPGKDGQFWPGIPKDDHSDSSNQNSDSSNDTGSQDDDPPFNPNLQDPTGPSSGNNSTVVERDTPGNPSRPPPSGNTVNTGSSSASSQDGSGAQVKRGDVSGAMQIRPSTVQSLGVALVCLLAALTALFSS